MIRTAIHITDKQHEELREESDNTGLPMAELIRRAIDEYLDRRRKKRQEEQK